jgi:signal transduction histidine kinase
MFTWSLTGLVETLFFVLSLYFIYVFAKKEDAPLKYKILIGAMLMPLVVAIPTRFNLTGFNVDWCYSLENNYALYYKYFIEIISSITIILFSLIKIKQADKYFRKQLVLLFIGVMLFLFFFFSTVFLSGYLVDNGIMQGYGIEGYGLFGTVIFMGFLAYLIVKFKTFDIKLIGAQALVYSLIIIIGSQFFFIQNNINRNLTGITMALTIGFGIFLINSVKDEIKRKEELQMMTNKLARANDKLRTLDNAKSEFISIASHQLRTPLTAIKGFVSLLSEESYGKLTPTVKEVLSKVYLSNERMIDLVEDLLNISRIESGRMEYKFEKINMPKLLQEIYDTFAIRAKESKLNFELIAPEGDFPEITTDRNKIREVISNLVDNALKYTPKGWIKIKLMRKEENIRIEISDTGIGVPQEEMPYLFSKFSRGKDVARLNVSGTGLGLHVGKRMIEALHGRIGVESPGANQGSTFFIEMPIEGEEV